MTEHFIRFFFVQTDQIGWTCGLRSSIAAGSNAAWPSAIIFVLANFLGACGGKGFSLKKGWVFLERTQIPSGIKCARHFINLFFKLWKRTNLSVRMETNELVIQ